jgi:4-amino-4-deoxychorismate lyase
MSEVWVNGVPGDILSVADRSVQYGDGLFETLRVEQGRPLHLLRHLARLRAGCARLHIGGLAWDALCAEIGAASAHVDAAVLKVIITRGHGARGYGFAPGQQPTRILALSPLPQRSEDAATSGIRIRVCSTRLASQPALAGIKHLNRLEQVLARAEWQDPAISEGLMLDYAGSLVEGTMSNLFLVRGGRLMTPRLSECGVAGVMRSVILDCAARQGIPGDIVRLTLDDARDADEVFVSNSVIGIWPVAAIEGIGQYRVGGITRSLLAAAGSAADSDSDDWYSS